MLDTFVSLLLLQIPPALYFHTVEGSDTCRELSYLHPVTGKALIGHVIRAVRVTNGDQCEIRCYQEVECLSYNLGPIQDNERSCDLSNSDHIRHPEDFVPMPGYIYRGTENHCSSSPCPKKAICLSLTPQTFQCLCPAGFTGMDCETDLDECQVYQHNCPVNEKCDNNVGSYTCTCVSGLYDRAGICQLTGKSCQDIETTFPHAQDGMYRVKPDYGLSIFWVYCDMTSFGGGWTMCYSTVNLVNLKTEVTFNEKLPYGTDGYRTDCNNVEFREILFVDETTGEKAFFSYQLNSSLVAAQNYETQLPGLWLGGGIANTDYAYQLLICDTNFYSGFFISGHGQKCKKSCNNWCADYSSPYFRSAASTYFTGVAFDVNGARPLSSRLISVGLR